MIHSYREFISESNDINRVGKKVLMNGVDLKTLNFKEVEKNIVWYYEEKGNFLFPKGKFFLWFTDSAESTANMAKGDFDLIMFPPRTSFNVFTVSPISDIWKKSHLHKYRGGEHVLGMIEGYVWEGKAVIEMMSVHKKFQGHKINTLMLDTIKNELRLDFLWEDPTENGYDFIKVYDKDPQFTWTSNYRPKNYLADHPEEKKK